MRTFVKNVGQNFDASDHRDTAAGFHWAPLMGGRAFDRAEAARASAEDRRKNKAYRLHIGVERVVVAGDANASIFGHVVNAYGQTVTPQDLTDEELAILASNLNAQVRETDADARALADEEAAVFEDRKARSIASLKGLLASVKSADDALGLELRIARNDLESKLFEWQGRFYARAETLRDNKATNTLVLANNEVNAELRARRAVQAAKKSELRAMLAEAGFSI